MKTPSRLASELLSSIRFHWHTMEWTGTLLIITTVSFFIITATTIYNMVLTNKDSFDIKCLATNIYHEARGEPIAGKYAVAVVTLNRVKSKKYPDDVCQVVYQQKWNKKKKRYSAAFSWTTDSQSSNIENKAWQESITIAKEVYYTDVRSKAADALFYHADYVKPAWASNKKIITKIGRHIFYR